MARVRPGGGAGDCGGVARERVGGVSDGGEPLRASDPRVEAFAEAAAERASESVRQESATNRGSPQWAGSAETSRRNAMPEVRPKTKHCPASQAIVLPFSHIDHPRSASSRLDGITATAASTDSKAACKQHVIAWNPQQCDARGALHRLSVSLGSAGGSRALDHATRGGARGFPNLPPIDV